MIRVLLVTVRLSRPFKAELPNVDFGNASNIAINFNELEEIVIIYQVICKYSLIVLVVMVWN